MVNFGNNTKFVDKNVLNTEGKIVFSNQTDGRL